MKPILALFAAATLLAACGVDGPPVPPPPKEEAAKPEPGLTISGTVEAGIAGSF